VIVLSANDITMDFGTFPTKWHEISGQNPFSTVKRAFVGFVDTDTMLNNSCGVEPVLYLLKVDWPLP